jgi:hypothetical protein
MPALPLDEAGGYVAAAYVVFVTLVVVYVVIIAAKVDRMRHELEAHDDHEEGVGGPWRG